MSGKPFKRICQTESIVKQDPVDWTKCFLCQEDKSEHLQDPTQYKGSNIGMGYATLSRNIFQL